MTRPSPKALAFLFCCAFLLLLPIAPSAPRSRTCARAWCASPPPRRTPITRCPGTPATSPAGSVRDLSSRAAHHHQRPCHQQRALHHPSNVRTIPKNIPAQRQIRRSRLRPRRARSARSRFLQGTQAIGHRRHPQAGIQRLRLRVSDWRRTPLGDPRRRLTSRLFRFTAIRPSIATSPVRSMPPLIPATAADRCCRKEKSSAWRFRDTPVTWRKTSAT